MFGTVCTILHNDLLITQAKSKIICLFPLYQFDLKHYLHFQQKVFYTICIILYYNVLIDYYFTIRNIVVTLISAECFNLQCLLFFTVMYYLLVTSLRMNV
jgi:hypothetical protein